jgi:hypothetical protein
MPGAVTPRLRFALAIMAGSAVAVLIPSMSATTMDAPATVLLAALGMALAAAVHLNSHVARLVARAVAPPYRTPDDVPLFIAGRITDPVHHPIRPRAPGMA